MYIYIYAKTSHLKRNSTEKEYQELISPRRVHIDVCLNVMQKLVGNNYEITCTEREGLLEFECNALKTV